MGTANVPCLWCDNYAQVSGTPPVLPRADDVTSPSSDNVLGFVERARVESGQMVGPRIFHTGDVIYGAGAGGIHNTVADLTDAHSALIRIKAEGGPASFSYKNYNQPSR